jgi:hypothetical protein
MTIVNDASTINVIDDASLALASIINYDCKWRYNLERCLLTTLGASITIVTRLQYRPLLNQKKKVGKSDCQFRHT